MYYYSYCIVNHGYSFIQSLSQKNHLVVIFNCSDSRQAIASKLKFSISFQSSSLSLERETRLELATFCLENRRSTNWTILAYLLTYSSKKRWNCKTLQIHCSVWISRWMIAFFTSIFGFTSYMTLISAFLALMFSLILLITT